VATAASSSTINLTWTDQSNNETGFKIERALGGGAFSQVATVGAGVTSYTDSGLTASTSYSYRVRASNSAGDSAYSNTASATTASGTTFDGVVNATTAAANGGFAYVLTQDFGTPPDTSACGTCSVLRIFENGTELGPAHSAHVDIRNFGMGRFSHWGTELYFSASDNTNPITNGRTYNYKIGSSSPTPPAAPTGLVATAASSSTINLTWTDQSNNETGFKIERALGGGAFSPLITVGANATTYADSGLTASTSYSYRVLATNSAGDSAYSNTASATTQASAPTAPAAPTGLVATAASNSAINLTWSDQSNNETGFKIERAPSGGTFSQVATVGVNVTTYSDAGLASKTSYSYRLRAYNDVGDSAYSNTASARTKPR